MLVERLEKTIEKLWGYMAEQSLNPARFSNADRYETQECISFLDGLISCLSAPGEDEKTVRDFFEKEIAILENGLTLRIGNPELKKQNLEGVKNLLAAFDRLKILPPGWMNFI